MPNCDDNVRLSQLLDAEDIRNVVRMYSRAIDRRDKDLLATLYWPDGTDVHGSFDGSATEFVEYAIWSVRRDKRTHHVMGETLIEFNSNRALAETYFISYHLRGSEETDDLHDEAFGGRYLDIFEKRDNEWRIFRRTMILDWTRRYPDTTNWNFGIFAGKDGSKVRLSARKPDDLLYVQHEFLDR